MTQFIKTHPFVPVIIISAMVGILCFVGGMEYQKHRVCAPPIMQWRDGRPGRDDHSRQFQDRQERRQENQRFFNQQPPASPAATIN